MTITFLELDQVLALHVDQIERYGGKEGVRDLAMLESAVAVAEASYGGKYLHATLPEMAAAYLFHIAQNHPFIDGNKRIAAVAARVFVLMNDRSFDPPEDEYEQLVLSAAAGKIDKSAVIAFFTRHVRT